MPLDDPAPSAVPGFESLLEGNLQSFVKCLDSGPVIPSFFPAFPSSLSAPVMSWLRQGGQIEALATLLGDHPSLVAHPAVFLQLAYLSSLASPATALHEDSGVSLHDAASTLAKALGFRPTPYWVGLPIGPRPSRRAEARRALERLLNAWTRHLLPGRRRGAPERDTAFEDDLLLDEVRALTHVLARRFFYQARTEPDDAFSERVAQAIQKEFWLDEKFMDPWWPPLPLEGARTIARRAIRKRRALPNALLYEILAYASGKSRRAMESAVEHAKRRERARGRRRRGRPP
jgi:hypothetical protein